MNITNKRSYVHQARKNAEEEPDLMLKWKLIKILRQKFKLNSRTGPKIAIHRHYGYVKEQLSKKEVESKRYWLHDPDVSALKNNPPLIFEIDGLVHFLNARGIRRTNDRNEHYEHAIISGKHPKLIWLTAEEMELSDERIEELLREKFELQRIRISSMNPP